MIATVLHNCLLVATLERFDIALGGRDLGAVDLKDLHCEDEHIAATNLRRAGIMCGAEASASR